ncbi:MAG: hypothetical protein GVY02_05060 [Bacteroidetes bacterium]|jgi:hypothetical protein|nr:hypothetical protein [Bacteroidota bacterium]
MVTDFITYDLIFLMSLIITSGLGVRLFRTNKATSPGIGVMSLIASIMGLLLLISGHPLVSDFKGFMRLFFYGYFTFCLAFSIRVLRPK